MVIFMIVETYPSTGEGASTALIIHTLRSKNGCSPKHAAARMNLEFITNYAEQMLAELEGYIL